MLQLTDGTIMIQNGSSQNWMRLTPDIHGSYVNGVWTSNLIHPMSFQRLYFASQVLPDGRVWILGGEYTGPFLDSNIAPSGEIWDPVTNLWSRIATYPSQPGGCARVTVTSNADIAAGTNVITGIYSTDRFQVGWTITGPGISAGATVTSVDSLNQVHISQNAIATIIGVRLAFNGLAEACFGDDPSILIPGGNILAGNIFNRSSYTYSIATDTWNFAGNKFYNDQSDEEGWTKLPDNRLLTYDIFQSIRTGSGYAELYDPNSGSWSGISPADGTANGTLPVLSSSALGAELGPILRLQDGRIFVIGANEHTALYTPSTNTWVAGPDMLGTLSNPFGTISPAAFGADDAPAALLPNGHVLLAADAGPAAVTSSGNTASGSAVITNIPSTAGLQTGWAVTQADGRTTVIPAGTRIFSVDSATQIRISNNAIATSAGLGLRFGGVFSRPTQIFDFDPGAGTLSLATPAVPDLGLTSIPSYVTRMLVLPTGQLLFSNGSNQLWVYTADGAPNPSLRPVVNTVTYNGVGVFTLTGKQLNGQSSGSAYGDDVESDENYPIVRLVNSTGSVYYCRTTNWSSTAVGGGAAPQTVNFTLNPALTAGNYVLVLSGAGIASFPLAVNITQAEVDGQ
ncbi:MAG TPA: kelch repeat-containing protein [Bryobacteraceae bacterium]|nr:kelch repeat-containing protein [Bryobacteraceae bacterium]